jgi:hypothetical protein
MVTPLFKISETTSPKSYGGVRKGAGRKSFDREFEDRRMLCMWLCDWFARQVGSAQRPASDSQCEQSVNDGRPQSKPEFLTVRSVLGGMWGKARRGERPFGPERMLTVCTAADKHKFWDVAWRRSLPKFLDDPLTTLLLALIAAEGGFDNQLKEKKQFKMLQTSMARALSSLLACTSKKQFDNRKEAALTALRDWLDFVNDVIKAPVGLRGGYVDIRHDLLAAEWGGEDPRLIFKPFNPLRTKKCISSLRFGDPLDLVAIARAQVCSMEYTANNFSDSQIMMKHIRRLKEPPSAVTSVISLELTDKDIFADLDSLMSRAASIETGTKLAQ